MAKVDALTNLESEDISATGPLGWKMEVVELQGFMGVIGSWKNMQMTLASQVRSTVQ